MPFGQPCRCQPWKLETTTHRTRQIAAGNGGIERVSGGGSFSIKNDLLPKCDPDLIGSAELSLKCWAFRAAGDTFRPNQIQFTAGGLGGQDGHSILAAKDGWGPRRGAIGETNSRRRFLQRQT